MILYYRLETRPAQKSSIEYSEMARSGGPTIKRRFITFKSNFNSYLYLQWEQKVAEVAATES